MPNPAILPIPPAVACQVNAAVAASRRLNLLATATVHYDQPRIIWILSDQAEKAPPELLAQIAQANDLLTQWQRAAQAQWQDPDPAQEPPRCWPINKACNKMACGRSTMEHGYTFNPNFVTCPQCLPNLNAGEPGYVDHRSRFGVAAATELARALLAAYQENFQPPIPQTRPAPAQSKTPAAKPSSTRPRQPALLSAA